MQFVGGALVIAFSVAAIAVQRIAVHINRFIGAIGPRDIDNDDAFLAGRFNRNIFARKNVDAGFIGIVDGVPEILYQFFRIRKMDCVERFVRMLFDTKQNDSA